MTGNFHPGTVTMPRGFHPNIPSTPETSSTVALPPRKQTQDQQGGDDSTCLLQVAVQNPAPLPHLQVGPGLHLRQSMEQAAETTGTLAPQIDDVRQLCLRYHLKNV